MKTTTITCDLCESEIPTYVYEMFIVHRGVQINCHTKPGAHKDLCTSCFREVLREGENIKDKHLRRIMGEQ